MSITRRQALALTGSALGLGALAPARLCAQGPAPAPEISGLKSMTGDVKPIAPAEYLARIDQARKLMGQHGIGALLIEPGASLVYFTGVQWWRSERLTAAILPRDGDLAIVTPHFEEPSVGESLQVPAEMRVWQECRESGPHPLLGEKGNHHEPRETQVAIPRDTSEQSNDHKPHETRGR
jgi:Xaa-Pro dipeptidase